MRIVLQPIGYVEDYLIEEICERMYLLNFKVDCRFKRKVISPCELKGFDGKEFVSFELLDPLYEIVKGEDFDFYTGLTNYAIYVPGGQTVYGIVKKYDGRGVAMISLYRLRQGAGKKSLLLNRAVKEFIHEFGHYLGLGHCRGLLCVMNSSGSLAGVDLKNPLFCPVCLTKIYIEQMKKWFSCFLRKNLKIRRYLMSIEALKGS